VTGDEIQRGWYRNAHVGELAVKRDVHALLPLLDDEDLREDVANALGDLGDPRAVPALTALLSGPEQPLFIGNAIAVALEEIGTAEAREAVAAWKARNTTPPDAQEWRVERLPVRRRGWIRGLFGRRS
jgi:HEAT repeat protein